jgi:hypothetical protein
MTDQDDIEATGKADEPVQHPASQPEREIEYPEDNKLFRIADWAVALSWVVLGLAFISILWSLLDSFFFQVPLAQWVYLGVDYVITMVLDQLETLLYAVATFLVLQAVSEIIYLLFDIRYLLHPEKYFEDSDS